MFRRKRIAHFAILGVAAAFGDASAAAMHEFCVTRVAASGTEVSRTRIYFRSDDPGREIAGHMLIQHYRRASAAAVRIDDDADGVCRYSDLHHISVHEGSPPIASGEAVAIPPNVGRVANQASGALTAVAAEASRLMCRILPC
jgi:hypothetical protein